MPLQLFSNKFQRPKVTPRRKLDFHQKVEKSSDEKNTIIIKLGENKAEFMKGEWMQLPPDQTKGIHHDFAELQLKYERLREENNLLKVKIEILFDMLTQATANCGRKSRKIQELEGYISTTLHIDLKPDEEEEEGDPFQAPEQLFNEYKQISNRVQEEEDESEETDEESDFIDVDKKSSNQTI